MDIAVPRSDFKGNFIVNSVPILSTISVNSDHTTSTIDFGRKIEVNSPTPTTLTFAGLQDGMSGFVIQTGSGQVSFVGAGLTVVNISNMLKSAGQYAIVQYVVSGSNVIITGDLSQ